MHHINESKINAFNGASGSPVGAGTFSTICSKISSIPIPAFAEANTASDASRPITSSISCVLFLDQHLVNQFY